MELRKTGSFNIFTVYPFTKNFIPVFNISRVNSIKPTDMASFCCYVIQNLRSKKLLNKQASSWLIYSTAINLTEMLHGYPLSVQTP
jgi:hypothetical protein